MNLSELRDEAFKIACDHGFHDTKLSDEHCLMLVITELSEAVEADRSSRRNRRANVDWFKNRIKTSRYYNGLDPVITPERAYQVIYDETIKGSIEEELADATIRLLDLAGLRKVDIEIPDEEWDEIIKNLKPDTKSEYSFTELMFHLCECIITQYNENDIDDVIINTLALIKIVCFIHNINLEWHIEMKMKYNSLRENKHGKKY